MNKSDLLTKVESKIKDKDMQSHAQIKRIVDAVFDSITESLSEKEEVAIYNFGTFFTLDKAETKVRHPQTGEKITIPAKTVAKFRPTSRLRKKVNTK